MESVVMLLPERVLNCAQELARLWIRDARDLCFVHKRGRETAQPVKQGSEANSRAVAARDLEPAHRAHPLDTLNTFPLDDCHTAPGTSPHDARTFHEDAH